MSSFPGALVVALVVLSGAPLAGGEGTAGGTAGELTLEEAIRRGRQSAREVAAAAERVRASEARADLARGHRLPTVRLQEIWTRTDSPAEAFALELNQERFSFARFAASDPNDPAAIESATTRLEASVPLFTGGELGTRIEQADLALEASRSYADWTSHNAALEAAVAYVRLAQAQERVALLERSLATASAHLETARQYVEQGMLVRSELLRAEVERAHVEDLVEEARGQAEVAASALAFRLGAQLEARCRLAPLAEPPEEARDREAWLALAVQRADVEAVRRQVAAAELEQRIGRAARLPRVGLVARYDLVDESPFGSSGDSTAVMVQASVDLYSGGRHRAAVTAAAAEAAAAVSDLARLEEAVRLEVDRAWVEARSARARHETAKRALVAAVEGERVVEERFRQGIARMIDLIDVSTAKREAEARELVARAEAHVALLELVVRAGLPPESVLNPQSGRRAGRDTRGAGGAEKSSKEK